MPPEDSSIASAALWDAVQSTQHTRLLRLRGAGQELVVERMEVREGVSRLFAMEIDCLALSCGIDTAALLGREVSLDMVPAGSGKRTWHGVVCGVAALGSDGGLARYRLQAAPWLGALALRRDSFVFQDKTARDILVDVFADYPHASYGFDIQGPLAARPIRTQYRESDLDFVLRVMAEDGLAFRFEHVQDGDEGDRRGGSRHRMVIFDARAATPACEGSPIRFHGSAAAEGGDAIAHFAAQRVPQAAAVTRTAWDDVALVSSTGSASSQCPGDYEPALEDYLVQSHASGINGAVLQQKADVAQAERDSARVRFVGYGGARGLVPGHVFRLTGHDRYDPALRPMRRDTIAGDDGPLGDRGSGCYTVLAVTHRAANNLGAGIASLLRSHDLERGTYRNRFTAQPDRASLMRSAPRQRTAPEAMTAVVVAATGSPLATGRDLRVKVQFPWQRGARPLHGGLPHLSMGDKKGNAPGDLASGTWLRVATAVAGPNWGMHAPIRAGTEVLVSFLDSDIDQPVVAASLYNDVDTPPWPAGPRSAANHPGTLAGWHSRSLAGTGYSQWLFDDASGQLRMRLGSSAAASQLGLGHLVEQAAESPRRGAWRGTGFELRSDAWVVVRSGQGMLLSTRGREMAQSTIADCSEALSVLKAARDAALKLDNAQARAGNAPSPVGGYFSGALEALDPRMKGRYPAMVNGQRAARSSAYTRDGDDPVECIEGPRMVIDSPASMAFATSRDISLFAGGDNQATSQSDTHVAADQTFCAVANTSATLFSQQGGIRAVAAGGRLSLQAHGGELELGAGRDIAILTSDGDIEILAKNRITLAAGDAAVVLQGADVMFHCPGAFSLRGKAHVIEGPSCDPARLPALPAVED